ncbi:MAG: beta-eliminating lyase-related protein [Comamonadaceae bacterium]|nr:beta-eliminating lyase-related protein [Comamonadaceae bacterium]
MTDRASSASARSARPATTPSCCKSDDVYIDLLTDSRHQRDERPPVGRHDARRRGLRRQPQLLPPRGGGPAATTATRYLVPTHQGRGAEHLLSQVADQAAATYVPGNMYFTTTRLHQELAGGTFVDVIIDEAHDPQAPHPFKGNIDLAKLERADRPRSAPRSIPYVSLAGTVNMAGGQPVSHGQRAQALRALVRAARHHASSSTPRAMVENAYFIQQREPGYARHSRSPRSCASSAAYTDGAWMSAKKDSLVNIGGWLAINDWDLFEELRNLVVVYEGLHTYGGMAGPRHGGDGHRHRRERCRTTTCARASARCATSASCCRSWDIPIVRPIGGHAIFLDAQALLPAPRRRTRSRRRRWPPSCTWTPASARWSAASSAPAAIRRPATTASPKLELTRLTIPRRVYTQAHMDVVAESVQAVYDSTGSRRAA